MMKTMSWTYALTQTGGRESGGGSAGRRTYKRRLRRLLHRAAGGYWMPSAYWADTLIFPAKGGEQA
ncbi:hypothetical protein [Paenibacillus mucilaginosus]|uniref:hypothetical protein n=1 Tax=Paenibacillus mucilaginosus TaxID=61624 RepID=UPI001F2648F0|nr:hypothetical protein [Paenibacillus mucilaginosus]